jgi:hypothetical protein
MVKKQKPARTIIMAKSNYSKRKTAKTTTKAGITTR